MGKLRLEFLGTPLVWHERQSVAFATRKALALLAYLSVEGGTHSREVITTLFWPESGSAPGRATLRSTLAFLREALGAAGDRLAAERETLRFEPEPGDQVDVLILRAAALLTRQLPLVTAAPLPAAEIAGRQGLRQILDQLQNAANQYRGDFLTGFSLTDAAEFDDWAAVQREAAHRQATTVFDWLAQLQSEGGELAAAIATTQRWTRHDPLNETAHRRLMQLHLANDDRAAALQAYAACRAVLAKELNAEPAPETELLAGRLRSGRQRQGLAARPRPVPGESVAMSDAPLIGRAAEHLALVAAFRRTRRNQGPVIVIEGEPGIGKTRLAHEFLAFTAGQGADRLTGRAYESGGQSSYQPLVEALRDRLMPLGAADLRELLSPTWLAELSRLLPELVERLPELPPPLALAEAEARLRLFEAVARLGARLAAADPLVVFIDDVHWADGATLDLLAYLGRRWRQLGLPVLLLLTARAEDLATNLAVADWLARLEREAPVTRVRLPALNIDDTLRLVRAVGVREPDEFGRSLFAETAGHPFYLLQTMRAMVEAGQLLLTPSGEWSLASGSPASVPTPSGVRALIGSRLARLSGPAQDLAMAGAVLGTNFDFDQLRRLTELDERAGWQALEELLARGLLRERGDLPGKLVFSHDKIREVAYAETRLARRRALHQRALLALAGAPAADLAPHALAAGLPERALPLLLTAGRDALRLLAPANAVPWLEQARSLARDQLPPSERCQLSLDLGRAYELLSQWEQARAAFQALLEQAVAHDLPEMQVTALNRLAAVAARGAFDLAASAALLEQAAGIAARQQLAGAGPIETELNLAQLGLYRWDVAWLSAHAQHALMLARELGQPEWIARCLNMGAYAGTISSQWEAMAAQADEARALYARLGDRLMEADSLALISAGRTHTGYPREGIVAGQAAYTIACELENDWAKANCTFYLAHALHEMGNYAEAKAVVLAGVAAGRAAGHPPLLAFNLAILGRINRSQGALDEALSAHLECRAIGEALHQPLVMEWAAVELCADHAVRGEWNEAASQARVAAPIRAHYPAVTPFAGQLRWYETEALIRAGDLDLARQDLALFDAQVGERRRYRLAYLRARMALAQALAEDARPYEQAALVLAREMELPGEIAALKDPLARNKP